MPALTTAYEFQEIRLSEFLDKKDAQTAPESCAPGEADPRLEERIAILGGFYSREDQHETPWGTRRGVELVAMAIEQVFRPEPLHKMAKRRNGL